MADDQLQLFDSKQKPGPKPGTKRSPQMRMWLRYHKNKEWIEKAAAHFFIDLEPLSWVAQLELLEDPRFYAWIKSTKARLNREYRSRDREYTKSFQLDFELMPERILIRHPSTYPRSSLPTIGTLSIQDLPPGFDLDEFADDYDYDPVAASQRSNDFGTPIVSAYVMIQFEQDFKAGLVD